MGTRVPATVQDIARRAGVSAGTVSRILNGKNKENRPSIVRRAEKVRRIASQLGYRPNAAARSMLNRRFGLIGFVTCGDPGIDWIPQSLLHGIHQAAEDAHMRVVISEVHTQQLADPDYIPPLLRVASTDGLIAHLDPQVADRLITQLEATNQALVYANSKRGDRAVYPDDRRAIHRITTNLLEQGRRNIAYLRYRTEKPSHYSHTDRRDGYLQAMNAAGRKPLVWELDASVDATPQRSDIIAAALAAHRQTDALVCYELVEAVTAHAAATQLGRSVPDELAIVAVHEREVRSVTGINIPTAPIPFYQVGLEAARMLTRMIQTGVHSEASRAIGFDCVRI